MLGAVPVVRAVGIGISDITVLFIGALEKRLIFFQRRRFAEREIPVDVLGIRHSDAAGKTPVIDFQERGLHKVFFRTFVAGHGVGLAVVIDEGVNVAARGGLRPLFEVAELDAVPAGVMRACDGWDLA